MARVNPRVSQQQPIPYPWSTLPATPRVYPSKIAQKRPKRPRIEGDRANFNEFYEISHISFSFGPKNMFLGLFKSPRVLLSELKFGLGPDQVRPLGLVQSQPGPGHGHLGSGPVRTVYVYLHLTQPFRERRRAV
jgi:hypothetical protein